MTSCCAPVVASAEASAEDSGHLGCRTVVVGLQNDWLTCVLEEHWRLAVEGEGLIAQSIGLDLGCAQTRGSLEEGFQRICASCLMDNWNRVGKADEMLGFAPVPSKVQRRAWSFAFEMAMNLRAKGCVRQSRTECLVCMDQAT